MVRVRPALRVFAALTFFTPCIGAAVELEQLPVIVTYELQRHRSVERELRQDPKGFWTAQILSQIEARRVTAPMKLSSMATVQVVFTVARDGHLVSSSIGKSSGLPEVDRIAAEMVAGAQPFPPMPAALADTDLTFVLPVRVR